MEVLVANNHGIFGQAFWDYCGRAFNMRSLRRKCTEYRARKNFIKRLRIALFTRKRLKCIPWFRHNQYTLGFHFLFKQKDNKHKKGYQLVGTSKKKKKSKKNLKIACPDAKRPKKMDTLCRITVTTAQDCCVCIKVLFYYFQEICRLITCLNRGKTPTTNFSGLFCQLGDVTVQLVKDFYILFKYVFKKLRVFYSKIEKCL